jgi:hypothetical protein
VISTLAAAALVYGFPVGKPLDYRLEVGLEGLIPVLGGEQATALVDLTLRVEGLPPEGGLQRARSEILEAAISFNGAPLPVGVEAVRELFPKSTISHTPRGEIVATGATGVQLPVRLPGLDVRRFPDISFMPVVFPEGPVQIGGSWTFRKAFGDSDATFVCTLTKDDGESATIGLKIEQTYETLEDAAMQIVAGVEDATARVRTEVKGEGEAVFDRTLGVFRSSRIVSTATSAVTCIADGTVTERRLTTTVRLSRVERSPTGERDQEQTE